MIVSNPKLNNVAPKIGGEVWRLIITPKPINNPANIDFINVSHDWFQTLINPFSPLIIFFMQIFYII